jgi:flagellar basal body rod protein FlgC
MSSIMSIGIAGMRAAETRFETAASRIVRAGVPPAEGATAAPEIDLGSEIVAMKLASYDFLASTRIIEVGRDMMKSAIDILA